MTRAFLTAHWRYVAMLNYRVDRTVLMPHVPRGTNLDEHNGHHFVSLIGFLFLDTRILGLPAFFHQDFEEVNLRFYVRRKAGDESRAGVVFLREFVPLPLVAQTAKLTYNEPYQTLPMTHRLVETNGHLQSVEYIFGTGAECRLGFHVHGDPAEMKPGSEEEFLSHRGWGYTRQRDGGTIEYRVDHPKWRVWTNARWEIKGPLGRFYEEPFARILAGEPASAFVADGSPVAVHFPARIS